MFLDGCFLVHSQGVKRVHEMECNKSVNFATFGVFYNGSPVRQLPLETIQISIAQYFKPRDLISSIRTCRNWKEVFDQELVRRLVFQRLFPGCGPYATLGKRKRHLDEALFSREKPGILNFYIKRLKQFFSPIPDSLPCLIGEIYLKAIVGLELYHTIPDVRSIPSDEIGFEWNDSPDSFEPLREKFKSQKHPIIRGVTKERSSLSPQPFIAMLFTAQDVEVNGTCYPKLFREVIVMSYKHISRLDCRILYFNIVGKNNFDEVYLQDTFLSAGRDPRVISQFFRGLMINGFKEDAYFLCESAIDEYGGYPTEYFRRIEIGHDET